MTTPVFKSFAERKRESDELLREQAFLKWRGAVNAAVIRKVGLSCDDLPDWNYRDAFLKGWAPSKAAAAVIRNAKES